MPLSKLTSNSFSSSTNTVVDGGTFTVDVTNNRVGINTKTPGASLDVYSDMFISEGSAPSSNSSLTMLSKFSDGQRGYVILKAESNSSGSSDLVIRSRNNFAEAERWRLDSAGRVTKPSQPSFCTSMNGSDTYSGAGWSRARLVSGQPVSHGESFIDFTNMRFTAPVAGRYFFSAAITMTGSTNTDGTIGFTKNGQGSPDGGRSTAYASGTGLGGMDCTYSMNLAAGDYVSVYFYQSGTQVTRNTAYAGYFSGFLIG